MENKEYGGYIEFEYYQGIEYHKNAISLNSGRSCVEYLIRAKNIGKIYMPYFLCDSISELCKKLHIEIEYYHIDSNFLPIFDKLLHENEWLYIVNFYGQISDEKVQYLKKQYVRIIVDNAQAFFTNPIKGIDTCYTCRKFFGVTDGGYLYTDTFLQDNLIIDLSYKRIEFLLGRMEKNANEFYNRYTMNNKEISCEPLKIMSKMTKNLMRGIDYEFVKQRRIDNFLYLHEHFEQFNKLNINITPSTFMYPLFLENGYKIREKLQKQKIYIPTLWPNVFNICTELDLEYSMAKNILPIPIDQRYSIEDMKVLIEEVRKCIT